jgi:hypothetical protein
MRKNTIWIFLISLCVAVTLFILLVLFPHTLMNPIFVERVPAISPTVYLIHDYPTPSGRHWCTMESLCRARINTVVFASDVGLFSNFLPNCNGTFTVKKLNYEEIFTNTPFEDWYHSPENQKSGLWYIDVADAGRWAIIKKFGGTYSDSDIIYFGPQMFSFTNRIAAQHNRMHGHYLNINFLSFQKNHLFVDRAIKKFVTMYDPVHSWGSVGPGLLTQIWIQCRLSLGKDCQNIELLSANKIQLIRPGTLRENLSRSAGDPLSIKLKDRLIKESYGLHFSNSELGTNRFSKNSLFHSLFTEYCPLVSKQFESELFEE